MAGWKQWVKQGLLNWQRWKYDRMLEEKTVGYDGWIRAKEGERFGEDGMEGELSVRRVPYEVCRDYLTQGAVNGEQAEVVLFVGGDGRVSDIAERVAAGYFAANRGVALAYGDEDVMGPDGIRYTPWLKPHWSPDTFLSFFYFGNVFAVRTEALRGLTQEELQWIWQGEGSPDGFAAVRMGVYRLCYVLAVKCGGFSVRDVERECAEDGASDRRKAEGEGFWFPVGHMDEALFHGKGNGEMELVRSQPLDLTGCPVEMGGEDGYARSGAGGACADGMYGVEKGKLSVVIPSKDNVEALKRCIRSVQAQYGKREGELACEVVVVDNGSADKARADLEAWLEGQKGADGIVYRYIYRKMPFHFSRMCNIGAKAAVGEALLFLNDDVEMEGDGDTWNGAGDGTGKDSGGHRKRRCILEEMYNRAKRRFTGAVGVKLFYPGSRRMQHAGIVNLRLGPVHKLQFQEDDTDYFYGWNRRERNVIAVTGACLAVERKKYEEVGGFPEELPVAFNDVDFCFSLFEKGYYQVVLQDAELYHYESMSRGNDDSREKLERLLGERDRLYRRHPRMYGVDPFYHKYLVGDMLSTGFDLKADYDAQPQEAYGKVREAGRLFQHAREDACVMVSLEYAGTLWKYQAGAEGSEERAEGGYLLQGYSFVIGSDNARYEKYLIFRPEGDGMKEEELAESEGSRHGRLLAVKAEPFVRRDVEGNLPDQVNVGMTGFSVLLGKGDLPPVDCQVGVMVKDKCSGQRLYRWTQRYLKGVL